MTSPASGLKIPLYLTPEHACPYLADQVATTAFVGTEVTLDKNIFSALLRIGYRRSGQHIYRPRCRHCERCIPVRIPAAQFVPNRSQQRCLKRNQSLHVGWAAPQLNDEHFALYERYINQRHVDGDMYPARREQFFDFLLADWCDIRLLEIRDADRLLACVVTDVAHEGYSAVYSFFEPDQHQRSLGAFAIMSLVALARLEQIPFVYLGYFIETCQKMSYKRQYRPLHAFNGIEWRPLDELI